MEVAPVGEMYTHVSVTGRYDETLAKNLYSQLISAVEFMVRKNFKKSIARNVTWLSSLSLGSMKTTCTIGTSKQRTYSFHHWIAYG